MEAFIFHFLFTIVLKSPFTFLFVLNLFILIGRYLLYNIVMAFARQQHELATSLLFFF